MSLSFVQRNKDYIFTPYLARNTYLTEDVIEFFSEEWVSTEWYSISEYARLTEPFIEKYIEKWSWSRISGCQSFSFAFAKKHKNNLFWRELISNPHIDFTNEQWVELQDIFPKPEVSTTDTTFIQEGMVQLHKSIQEFAKSFPKIFKKDKK